MPDVPSASLYRHIKILNDSAFIIVVEENRIRGTVENVYSLNREALEVDAENGTAVWLSLLSYVPHLQNIFPVVMQIHKRIYGCLPHWFHYLLIYSKRGKHGIRK